MSTKQVLAFEADPIYAELLRTQLEARSISLTIVTDANEGLEKAASMQPDLIYLCAELPRTSGFSVCYKLRKNSQTQAIPIIITSAEATEETIEKHKQLQNLRADEYVQKPFGPDVLRGLLEQYLGLSEEPSAEFLIEEINNSRTSDEISFESVAVEDDSSLSMDEFENFDELEPMDAQEATEVAEVGKLTDSAFDSITEESAAPETPNESAPEPIPEPPPRRVSVMPPHLSSSARTPELSGTIRDLLDLREIINKKDRELIDVKDKSNKKEKQLLDLRERLTNAERERADLEDRALGFEKQIADLNDRVLALSADKEVLIKKGEDLQNRLNRSQAKSSQLEEELDEERKLRKQDQEQAEADKTESLSQADAEHARAMDAMVAKKDQEREVAIGSLRSELAAEQEAALLSQKNQLETEALAAREEALAKQRRRYEQEAQETAAKMRTERDDALFKLRTEMEDTAADIAKAHGAVIEDWERRAEDFRGKISNLETALEQQRQATDQAQTRAETTQHALDVRTSELITAKELIDELTSEKGTLEDKLAASIRYSSDLRSTLADREERIAVLEANLVATSEVVSRNEELIGRTRQALAIATQLLEQVEAIEPFAESEDM